MREPGEDFLHELRAHTLVDYLDGVSILIHLESKDLRHP